MPSDTAKTCFVVQGFGEKTDLATGRTLNLDASYDVIKEAVEAAGLRCVRADEIVHSGTIDQPMYDALYRAELLIADLSTSNVNAAFELGVRYGLRPRATIIVAEQGFKNPFDLTHIVIRRYEHLGKDIGRREAARFKTELVQAIETIVNGTEADSPVYTFLNLEPPAEIATIRARGVVTPQPAATPDQNPKQLLDIARTETANGNFAAARALLEAMQTMRPNDPYVVQQLALVTYKSKLPDPATAFERARQLLLTLDPDTTNDPETLGLWGALHKRLWELSQDRAQLDIAIGAYERGFYLRQDYYNGVNLAFLLNVRATLQHQAGVTDEATADFVVARRVRREVVRLCERELSSGAPTDQRFWIVATLWEAACGLGDAAAAEGWERQIEASGAAPWMLETARAQVARLRELLASASWIGH